MPGNARRPRMQVRTIVSRMAAALLAAVLLSAMAAPAASREGRHVGGDQLVVGSGGDAAGIGARNGEDPTAAQLAERLDREVRGRNAAVHGVLAESRAAERRADAKVAQSRRLALAAMVLGLVGILLAGIAIVSARGARRWAPAPPVQPAPLRAGPERTRRLDRLQA